MLIGTAVLPETASATADSPAWPRSSASSATPTTSLAERAAESLVRWISSMVAPTWVTVLACSAAVAEERSAVASNAVLGSSTH